MAKPTLLLRPGYSRDRNGEVVPTITGGFVEVEGDAGRSWSSGEATTNYVINPRIENVNPAPSYAWDQSLNGAPREPLNWSTYNGGVPSPGVGYHAHVIEGGGPNGENCIALLNRNAQFGHGGRYLAGSVGLNQLVGPVIAVGSVVTVSFDMKSSDTACYITAGIYHRNTSGAMTFTGATGNVYNTKPGTWERRSVSYTVESAWDLAYAPRLYMYGQNGPEGDKWFANVQVEVKGYATPCAAGSDGAGHAWTGALYGSASTRAFGRLYINQPSTPYYSTTEGTVVAQGRFGASAIGGYNAMFGPGTTYGRLYWISSPGRLSLGMGGEAWLITTPWDYVPGDTYRMVATWKDGVAKYWVDGEYIGEAPYSGWTAATTFNLGSTSGATNSLNGGIDFFGLMDDAASTAEVDSLFAIDTATWASLGGDPSPVSLPEYESSVYIMAPRIYTADINNEVLEDITTLVTSAGGDADIDRAGPKSTFRIEALNPDVVAPRTWVAPYLDIIPEQGDIISAQRGLFELDEPTVTYTAYGDVVASNSGVDIIGVLQRQVLTSARETAAGAPIMATIITELAMAGITRHAMPDDTRTATTPIVTKAGATWLERINQQLAALGMHAIYALPDGRPTSRPQREPRSDTPARVYTIGEDARIVGEVVTRRATSRPFNRIVAIKEDYQTGTALVSIADNDDPEHPWSIPRIGVSSPSTPITSSDAVDQAALDAVAEATLARVSVQETLSLQVLPDPLLAVHDVVEVAGDDRVSGRWAVEKIAEGITSDDPLVRIEARRIITMATAGGA